MTYYHICRARTVDLKIKMDQKMNFKLLCLVKSVRMVITAPTDLTVRNTKKAYLIETSYTATQGANCIIFSIMLKKYFLLKTLDFPTRNSIAEITDIDRLLKKGVAT